MGSCVGRRNSIVANQSSRTFVIDTQLLDRFTEHQVQHLRSKFHECSTSAYLDKKGLIHLFPGLKTFPPQVVNRCFHIFSENTHQIKFRTFCLVLAQLLLSSKEDQSRFVFSLFDIDSDDRLSEQELDLFLRSQHGFLRKLSESPAENIKLHKEKILAIPVARADFINWSLRNIELSDMLKPFEIIPSPASEKTIIAGKLLNNDKLEADENVYIISKDWWEVWRAYVHFGPEEEMDFEESNNEYATILPLNRRKSASLGDRPVAIDNADILECEGSIRLKNGLSYKNDFIWLKKHVWEQLYEWYGGGPELQRKVLFENNKLTIELYPLMFYIIPLDNQGNLLNGKKKPVTVSKSAFVKDLFLVSCKVFEKPIEHSRILQKIGVNWIACENSKPISSLTDLSEILIEASYVERSVLVWPIECVVKADIVKNPILPSNSITTSSNSNRSSNIDKPALKVNSLIMQGISGLVNLGNTCFLNSVLQSLLHTPMFAELFTGASVVSFINPSKTKEKDLLTLELNTLGKEMVNSKISKVSPVHFHKKFLKKFPMFSGSEQHDCHECLSLLLDSLHQELIRIGEDSITIPLVLENPADKQIEIKEADDQWKSLQGNRGSLVSDVCGGQTRTTLSCENCGHRKVLFEIFNNLSLPIPAKMEIPLNITVVLLSESFVQVTVVISRFAKIAELVEEVSKLVYLPKEKIVIGEYFVGSNLSNLSKYENEPLLRFVRDTSNLFAYEVLNTIEAAESYGKKLLKYHNQGPYYRSGQHVDVKMNEEWKTGKVVEILGESYMVSMDYEDKTQIFHSDTIAPFRIHTIVSSQKILIVLMYHQTLRNETIIPIGFPQLVSIGSWYTYADLYELSVKTAMRFSVLQQKPDAKEMFILKILDIATLKCGICKACEGCPFPNDKTELKNIENFCIGVEWKEAYFKEDIIQHDSVNEAKKINFRKPIDISSCFDAFMNKEKLESTCEKCKENKMSIQVDIWRVPDILILNFKRFAFEQGIFDKIDQPISIPFYAFDISQWVKGVEISGGLTLSTTALQNAYDLYAIILHSGGIAGGHYTSLIKIQKGDENMWVIFDDAFLYLVKEDPDNLMVAQNAYMLFYRRRKFSSSNVINLTYNFA